MRLLPEWAKQEAVILAWPDADTDWHPWLSTVREVYINIIAALNAANTGVLLLVKEHELAACKALLPQDGKVLLIATEYNDTWVRDYGFLSCQSEQGMQPVEFHFNGWGQKFDARKDNEVNRTTLAPLCRLPLISVDLIAEGGALEIDDNGHLLSTQFCLSNPKRNGDLSFERYTDIFKQALGATKVSIFEHGHLEGDDTDGHIDTLVRFTLQQGLVIQSAFNRPDDGHFAGLAALVDECKAALPQHQVFELPLPAIYNAEGDRLPASYANYLICNQHVLCPVYQQPEDTLAMTIMQQAYPDFKIVPINCLPLVQQFGSLHCISMQVPVNTLKPEIISRLNEGVSQL
ncbi:agmatine deiminase family protein [Flavobacterium sp. W21_SRS_FM6]|uniref:agmatine deiminase family protein n=1 Tax=Flavobacterium sp. W21_SRS_FM6 TaxID=3240268 RepID=UPI003F8E5FFB